MGATTSKLISFSKYLRGHAAKIEKMRVLFDAFLLLCQPFFILSHLLLNRNPSFDVQNDQP